MIFLYYCSLLMNALIEDCSHITNLHQSERSVCLMSNNAYRNVYVKTFEGLVLVWC